MTSAPALQIMNILFDVPIDHERDGNRPNNFFRHVLLDALDSFVDLIELVSEGRNGRLRSEAVDDRYILLIVFDDGVA